MALEIIHSVPGKTSLPNQHLVRFLHLCFDDSGSRLLAADLQVLMFDAAGWVCVSPRSNLHIAVLEYLDRSGFCFVGVILKLLSSLSEIMFL